MDDGGAAAKLVTGGEPWIHPDHREWHLRVGEGVATTANGGGAGGWGGGGSADRQRQRRTTAPRSVAVVAVPRFDDARRHPGAARWIYGSTT
jgi:hypothetical protein